MAKPAPIALKDDPNWLKQKFKFQSKELAQANTKIRKLEKALAAKPKDVIELAEDHQVLSLAQISLQMILAEPSWGNDQKIDAIASLAQRTSAERVKGGKTR